MVIAAGALTVLTYAGGHVSWRNTCNWRATRTPLS